MQPRRQVPQEGLADLAGLVVLRDRPRKATRSEIRLPGEVELVYEELERLRGIASGLALERPRRE